MRVEKDMVNTDALTILFAWIDDPTQPQPTDEQFASYENLLPTEFWNADPKIKTGVSVKKRLQECLVRFHPDKNSKSQDPQSMDARVARLIIKMKGISVNSTQETPSPQMTRTQLMGVQFQGVAKNVPYTKGACPYFKAFVENIKTACLNSNVSWEESIAGFIGKNLHELPPLFLAKDPYYFFYSIYCYLPVSKSPRATDSNYTLKHAIESELRQTIFEQLMIAAMTLQINANAFGENGEHLICQSAFDHLAIDQLFYFWRLYASHFPNFSFEQLGGVGTKAFFIRELLEKLIKKVSAEQQDDLLEVLLRLDEIIPLQGLIQKTNSTVSIVDSLIVFSRYVPAELFSTLISRCFHHAQEKLSVISLADLAPFLTHFLPAQSQLCEMVVRAKVPELIDMTQKQVFLFSESRAVSVFNNPVGSEEAVETGLDPLTIFLNSFCVAKKTTDVEVFKTAFRFLIQTAPEFTLLLLKSDIDMRIVSGLLGPILFSAQFPFKDTAIVYFTAYFVRVFQKENQDRFSRMLSWMPTTLSSTSAEHQFCAKLEEVIFDVSKSLQEKSRMLIGIYQVEAGNFSVLSTNMAILISLGLLRDQGGRCALSDSLMPVMIEDKKVVVPA